MSENQIYLTEASVKMLLEQKIVQNDETELIPPKTDELKVRTAYKIGIKILKLYDKGNRPDAPNCSRCPWENGGQHCIQDLIEDYVNRHEQKPLIQ